MIEWPLKVKVHYITYHPIYTVKKSKLAIRNVLISKKKKRILTIKLWFLVKYESASCFRKEAYVFFRSRQIAECPSSFLLDTWFVRTWGCPCIYWKPTDGPISSTIVSKATSGQDQENDWKEEINIYWYLYRKCQLGFDSWQSLVKLLCAFLSLDVCNCYRQRSCSFSSPPVWIYVGFCLLCLYLLV